MKIKVNSSLIIGVYLLSFLLVIHPNINFCEIIPHSLQNNKVIKSLHKSNLPEMSYSVPQLASYNPRFDRERDESLLIDNPKLSVQNPFMIPGWADTRWNFRKNITIEPFQIDEDLLNFPLYVELYDEDLQHWAQISGNDILFTDEMGNKLPHELIYYKRIYNSTHSRLCAWIKTNLSSSQDTIISLYYNNPQTSDSSNVTAVWTDYEAVWHLEADGFDSTCNANHGTVYGTDIIPGKLGFAQLFEKSTTDRIVCGNNSSLGNIFAEGGALEFWMNRNTWSIGYTGTLISKTDDDSFTSGWDLLNPAAGYLSFTRAFNPFSGSWKTTDGSTQLAQWYHIVITYDDSDDDNDPLIYINGLNSGSEIYIPTGTSCNDTPYDLIMGNTLLAESAFDGILDEVWIGRHTRSEGWVTASYANQNDPSNFYIIGAAERIPIDDWAWPECRYRKKLSISKDYIGSSLTDFPVFLEFYDTDLRDPSHTQSIGYDIRFGDREGNQLVHEIETFDQSYNSTHAHLEAWVRIPFLSDSSDTIFYLYYDNDIVTDQGSWDYKTWNENYDLVYHFTKTRTNPWDFIDSTIRAFTVRPTTLAQQTDGFMGKAVNFNGISQKVYFWSPMFLAFGDNVTDRPFTISTWIYSDTTPINRGIFSKVTSNGFEQGDDGSQWSIKTTADGQLSVYLYSQGYESSYIRAIDMEPLKAQKWYSITVTYDGSGNPDGLKLYRNGTEVSYAVKDGTGDYVAMAHFVDSYAYLGCINLSTGYWSGTMDEVRISNLNLSSDWIQAEFQNQDQPQLFVTNEDISGQNRNWWAAPAFNYRKNLNFNEKEMLDKSGNLYNLPMAFEFYDTDLHNPVKAQPEGSDILFTNSSGYKFHHEIDIFEQNYNTTHARVTGWLLFPYIENEKDLPIVMYYGNTTLIPPQETPEGVWRDFKGVWHMSENPAATPPQLHDSSSSHVDGMAVGSMGTSDRVSGVVGVAWDFDGVDDFVDISHETLWDTGQCQDTLCISAWIYLEEHLQEGDYYTIWGDDNASRFQLKYEGGEYWLYWYGGGNYAEEREISLMSRTLFLNVWHHVFLRRVYGGILSGDPAWIVYMYFDDGNSGFSTIRNEITTPDLVGIGGNDNTTQRMNGCIDEVLISTRNFAHSEIDAFSMNQRDPTQSFSTIGEETVFCDYPPQILDFGVDDYGNGSAIYWARIVDDLGTVTSTQIKINATIKIMSFNGSVWIHSSPVNYNDYLEYQIINTTDSKGNCITTPSPLKSHRYDYDTVDPKLDAWEYNPTIGSFGTFYLNASDPWGAFDTAIINVTQADGVPRDDLIAILTPITIEWEFMNDSLIIPEGIFYFDFLLNDTEGNLVILSGFQGFVPPPTSNTPPIATNLILSRSVSMMELPIYSNSTLYLLYDFYDSNNNSEGGTEIRWYKNGELQITFNDLNQIPETVLLKTDQWYATVLPKDGQDFGNITTSPTITIQNTPPLVTNFRYLFNDVTAQVSPKNIRIDEFYVEDEGIMINYAFNDTDPTDLDHSLIQWFRRNTSDDSWIEALIFENSTLIPATITTPGEEWYCQITASDSFDFGNVICSQIIQIESRPIIYNYEVIQDHLLEGRFQVEINVTNAHHVINNVRLIITFDDLVVHLLGQQKPTGWNVEYTIGNLSYLNTEIFVSIVAETFIPNTEFSISSITEFSFILLDKAAPRVREAYFTLNNDHHPTELIFNAEIEEYGVGIEGVTLFYYFDALTSGSGSEIYDSTTQSEQFIKMIWKNQTEYGYFYTALIPFQQNKTDYHVIYRIATSDINGNINLNAFNILNDPDRIQREVLIYKPTIGLDPTFVYVSLIIITLTAFLGSFIYVKFIKKPKLVGLDKDLVLSNVENITNQEIIRNMDFHTIGIIISFFDQKHGPIPIVIEPDILKDNFSELISLSDKSFSSCGFMDDSGKERTASFDFVFGQNSEVRVLSYAFALDRPKARSGKEHITLNILIQSHVFPLVNHFISELTDAVHKLHFLMDKKPHEKTIVIIKIQQLRRLITKIICSYEQIYGTTDLFNDEEEKIY